MQHAFLGRLPVYAYRLAVALALSAGPGAAAQAAYPEAPVSLVVGFAAGGPTDAMARVIATELSEQLKQSVIVENKPGAGSNIAAALVARAKPDGHTLLMVAVTSAINQTLYAKPGFNLGQDFAPVGLVGKIPSLLVVNPSLPVHSVAELVDYARQHPGALTFASSGNGTSIHIAGEMFRSAADIDVTHVPFKGSAPAGVAVMGGQVSYMFDNVPTVWPFVQSGRMRALAVTTRDRLASAPDLPTMAESGFPEFDVASWYGLIAPAGTPPQVIKTLDQALQAVIARPDFPQRMQGMGVLVQPGSPAEFGAFMNAETERWAPIVRASGARID